jgi:hypothetical protein
MAWTSRAKDLSTTSTTPHASSNTAVVGRAPGVLSINFSPAEFFGAGARCSHLHIVNPAVVSPESMIVKSLVEQHVDNTSYDFAVLTSANKFKDYVKSYFAGTIASALAYLAMIEDGYVWSDHFENIKKAGNPSVKRSPDFVFARPGQGDVALMESKGTRSETSGAFDTTVKDGYVGQIEPHLGYSVGTATATHGYSIGSWLTSSTKAELNIHHTDAVSVSPPSPLPPSGSIAAVQQNNYATAFRLAHSEELSRQVRSGEIPDEIPFFQFEWLDRKWLTSRMVGGWSNHGDEHYLNILQHSRYFTTYPPYSGYEPTFAVDRSCAETLLKALSGFRSDATPFPIEPLSETIRKEARGGEAAAAVFPDGLAVSYNYFSGIHSSRIAVWLRKERRFKVFE